MSRPADQREPPPAAPSPSPRAFWGGLALRLILTVLGAAGLIVGGLLDWIRRVPGTDLTGRALFQTSIRHGRSFITSVGFIVIVLGLAAVVGLAMRSGWLTRLAGVLGIVVFVLFLIEVYRSKLVSPGDIRIGAWLALAGGAVALVAGFAGPKGRDEYGDRRRW